jgi:hypothetical protein
VFIKNFERENFLKSSLFFIKTLTKKFSINFLSCVDTVTFDKG